MSVRPMVARLCAAFAMTLSAVGVMVLPTSPAVAKPASACTTQVEPTPLWAPHGTTWYLHHGVSDNGVATSASTIEQDVPGQPAGAKTLGSLPSRCVLDGLSYSVKDGFLYALASAPGTPVDVPLTKSYRPSAQLVRIGLAAGGGLTVREVTTLPTGGDATIRAVMVQAADSNEHGQLLIPQVSLGARGLPEISLNTYGTDGALAASLPLAWSSSCDGVRDNYLAQYMLWLASSRRGPLPPTLMGDWSYRHADKRLYTYVAADAHDAYLDKLAYVPTGLWKVQPMGDQLVRVAPDSGAIDCAPVRGTDRGPLTTTTGSPTGAQVMGSAFHGDGTMMDLYQSAEGARWAIDPTACFTAAGCDPVRADDSVPGAGRSHGDAAANLGPDPVDVRLSQGKITVGKLRGKTASVRIPITVRNAGGGEVSAGFKVTELPGEGLRGASLTGDKDFFDCDKRTCVAKKPLRKGRTVKLTVRAEAGRGQFANVAYVSTVATDVEADRPSEEPNADTDTSQTATNNDDQVVVRVIDTAGRKVMSPLGGGVAKSDTSPAPRAITSVAGRVVPMMLGVTVVGVLMTVLIGVLAFRVRPRE